MTPVLTQLVSLDARLVAAGFPPTSPWWTRELRRFLKSGKRRWVIRAGRRAGKSSTLCRLAVAVALAGQYSIPPGDVGVISFTSTDRDEAAARLTAKQVPCRRSAGARYGLVSSPSGWRGFESRGFARNNSRNILRRFCCAWPLRWP